MDVEMNKNSLFDLAKLKELGGYKAGDLLAVDPELYQKFMKHSTRTVKRDVVTKNMVFLTGLSAFTNEPINLFLRGESSTGKTYNVIEVLKYFPKEDVWLLGGLSPTALVHDKGKLVDENGEEIELEKKPVKPHKTDYQNERDYRKARQDYKEQKETWIKRLKNSYYIVDLSGKILVFLEAPHIETFNRLRPILSHDNPQISYKFTDKTSRGKLQTQHVVIQGFPACIFCTTSEKYLQDLATRSFTVTPEITEEKYHDANVLTGTKAAFPWEFERDFDLNLLEGYLRFLRNNLSDFHVVVPYGKVFAEKFPSRFPRSMRDFKHVLELVKVLTLFHVAQRPVLIQKVEDKEQCYVMAVREDYEFVMDLWREIRETTETSAPGQIMRFFHEVVEKISTDYPVFQVKDLVDAWNSKFKQKKSSRRIREWVNFLCDVGYMTKNPNPNDKRSNFLTVIKEKNGEKGESQFAIIFTLDLFKEWLEQAKQILRKNSLKLKQNFVANGESSCEDIFQKFFLNNAGDFRNILLGDSKASFVESGEEITVIQKTPQSPHFKNFKIEDILKVERLGSGFQDKCSECGFQGPMDYQVTFHNGEWALLCGVCGVTLIQQKQGEIE